MRRYDVSRVPPQGGYLAKHCPVRAQNDVVVPATPIPVPPELQRRFDRGKEFERDVLALLLDLHPHAQVIRATTTSEAEAATSAAMAARAPLIVGGRLPTDIEGRRVGVPDFLIEATPNTYRAVDIKHHLTMDQAVAERRGPVALVAPLEVLRVEDATSNEDLWIRKREEDLLQLAHYQRMLEAAGLAPDEGRWGGIIGVERAVVWYDLDAPMWKTPSSTGKTKMRSTMEVYDFEFDFRLDVLAVAALHQSDPTVPLLVEPVRIAECQLCPWFQYCDEQLHVGAGDVSLLPRVGWREWKSHRDRGVRDRAALGALDSRGARLAAAGVDVLEFQRLVEGLPDDTPVRDLGVVVRAKSQLARLEEEGVATFGDIMRLDAKTAAYASAGLTALPEQIDLARAALGDAPVYRRRGIEHPLAPRADIEVDVDMENVEDGVYLWGALKTVRSGGAASSEYLAFVTWEPLTPEEEASNSLAFWTWLMEEQRQAHMNGASFRAYCYNASAENTYLKRLGVATGTLDEVAQFIQSDEWVDLLRVVEGQLITGGGVGLKAVAPLAGFHWDVDDPGGGLSMLQYDAAVGAESDSDRETARSWLLTYNRGDVAATLAIRDWLEGDGGALPSIESLDPNMASTRRAAS